MNNVLGPLYEPIHRKYRVFIKYCVFSEDFKNIPDSGLSLFSLVVRVCRHNRQVETAELAKFRKIKKNSMKKHNI